MKKAYRILAILLCLSMLFALAACSAKQEKRQKTRSPTKPQQRLPTLRSRAATLLQAKKRLRR